MANKDYSRRKFINRCFSIGSLFLGGVLFFNCRGKNESSSNESENKKQITSEDSCNGLTSVSAGEIKKRESLGYVTKSSVPDNICGNCSLFIPPKPNEECGRCILFRGPVHYDGHCVQWASITS
ncbi:MAG: hypothetical protein QM485_11465 [Flavobacteriaceae bacterium]